LTLHLFTVFQNRIKYSADKQQEIIMDQFVWKPGFALGITEIDLQHQTLLKYLNECIRYASGHDAIVDTHGIINDLKSYARLHFTAEEALLRKVGYPGSEEHQQRHRLFEEQVAQMEQAVSNGEKHAVTSLVSFLRDWYMQHVLVEDKRYAEYMQAKGYDKNISIW